jgi:hypothetical protein
MGSGESCPAALMTPETGGLGSGIGSGESCRVRVRGLALAANMRSAIDAKRAVGFNILEKISSTKFARKFLSLRID